VRAFVIGTAGHVDHGKTALVKALTGVDTDRWREEKERGLTIDLGFARLPAGPGRDLEAAVIDVPGHEDFVKNMLAGATGIDVVLLVVAADEGPMPQTREHLVIARLLGVRHGVVALTKVDRVEAEWRDLAAEAVRDELRLVLGHDEWPIVPVSSTAETGLEALRAELLRVSEKLAPRGEDDLFRLPVDRAFAVAGAGTVITGTSWSGTAAVGEEILLLPQGIRARIRSLQMHGQARDVVGPGRRCALALVGVDSAAVSRGTVAVRGPGWLAVSRLGARLTIPGCLERSIEQGQRVRVHLGTREVMARVDLEDTLRPGASGWARLRLEQPLVARTRDRFVLRFYSPISTLGGGIVAELDPPGDWRQRTSRWSGLLETGVEKALEAATELRGGTGLPIDQAPVATGISASELASAAALEGGIVEIGGRWFPAAEVRACREDVLGALSELHRRGRRSRAVSLAALRREAQ
jgi:selenocysteine-specific elongation factor